MQMHFDELFQINPDDVATPKVHVRIGIKTLPPNKSTIHVSAKVVGDVPFSDFVGRMLEVDVESSGLYIVKGVVQTH